jgi:hypothetical protein
VTRSAQRTDDRSSAALSRTELLRAVAGGGLQLRSLDALHLVAAMRADNTLRAVVTYDARMIDAAEQLGIATAAPK